MIVELWRAMPRQSALRRYKGFFLTGHLRATKIKARLYFGIASNDDMRQPDAKAKLKEVFGAAKLPKPSRAIPDAWQTE